MKTLDLRTGFFFFLTFLTGLFFIAKRSFDIPVATIFLFLIFFLEGFFDLTRFFLFIARSDIPNFQFVIIAKIN